MGHMLKAARHDAIVELLRDRPAMRTVDVARNLNVSMATARRDCIALENKGIIERSWGGIQLVTSVDDHFGDVMNQARMDGMSQATGGSSGFSGFSGGGGFGGGGGGSW